MRQRWWLQLATVESGDGEVEELGVPAVWDPETWKGSIHPSRKRRGSIGRKHVHL